MPIAKDKLKLMLDNEETDYSGIVMSLGIENLEHLVEFAKSKDQMLAQKAVYLASLMKDNSGLPVLETASKSDVAVVKIAVASGLNNLTPSSSKNKLTERLLQSNDLSIQKLVLRSVSKVDNVSANLKAQIETLSKSSNVKMIKDLSTEVLNKIK